MLAMRFALGVAAIPLVAASFAQAQIKATCSVTSCAAPRAVVVSSGMPQLEQTKLTAANAIAVAEKHDGGRIVLASLIIRGTKASYTVVGLPNLAEVWRGSVDANSGALIEERVAPSVDTTATDQIDPSKAKLAERARLPLQRAVKRAEAKFGARVLDASLESANGRPVYQMQVVRGDDVEDLVVDPADGAVTLAPD